MEELKSLEGHAKDLGYYVSYTSMRPTAVNHKHKVIYLPQFQNKHTPFSFAHEIGHIIDHKRAPIDINKYKSNKLYRLFKEAMAWKYGYTICNLNDVPTKGYIKYALRMWMTYVRQ